MLRLEINKGEETMKTSVFRKYIVGTAACMKRLMIATIECVQLT